MTTVTRIDARSLRDADSPTETTLIAGTPTPANRRLYLLSRTRAITDDGYCLG